MRIVDRMDFENITQPHHASRSTNRGVMLLALVSAALVARSFIQIRQSPDISSVQNRSTLDRILSSRVLKVGYAGFPPYTIINLNEPRRETPDHQVSSDHIGGQDISGQDISGLCADIIKEVAERQTPPWKIEWHKVSWETLRADMNSGAFDVLAEPVYITPAKASQFLFSSPISVFGAAIGVVRKGETRFAAFNDLNDSSVIISLAEGWTSTEFAQRNLPKAKMRILPVGEDPFISFFDVISGRADVALQDAPTTIQFARKHPQEVELRWVQKPPTNVAAGFLLRREDIAMKHFLDAALIALQVEGTIEKLDRKWSGLGHYQKITLQAGLGLEGT